MKLATKILSPVLAAVIAGQSVVAFAQEAAVPQTAMSTAERSQDRTQDKALAAIDKLAQEAEKQGKVIQSLQETLAGARLEGSRYVAKVKVSEYWMETGVSS